MTQHLPFRRLLNRFHPWAFALMLATLAIPYTFTLGNPFFDDDWLFLHYYRNRPLLSLFDPHVLWFYRPLQSMLFASLYRLAGLNALPYNLLSLTLFCMGAALWQGFLLRLLRRPGWALLASLLLLVNWQFRDVVFWKSNYGALLGWLGTSAALHAALSDARAPRPRYLALASLWFTFALLAKETSIQIPFLAALTMLYARRGELAAAPGRTLWRVTRRLTPLWGLLAAYLAFHHYCVVDVETISQTGYTFEPPLSVLRHWLQALNHLLLFFDYSPFLGALDPAMNFVETRLLLLPLLLWAYAIWRRDALLLFALCFAAAALMPTILLTTYHYSRYYLLPASGMMLAWVALARRAVAAMRRWPPLAMSAGRMALITLLAVAALRSEAKLFEVVRFDSANIRLMERFQKCIVINRKLLPPDACMIFDGLSPYACNGMGVREMVKILLGSERAEGFKNGMRLPDEYVRRLNAEYPNKFRIFLNERGLVEIQPVGGVQVRAMGK